MTDDTAARLRALAQAERNALNALSDADPPVPLELRMAYDTAFDALLEAIDGETLLALLDALDEARRERDEQKRVIDDAYAALGPDAWWMDPPDGGSPTLAEMVAKANEDGRALYSVKRERDAAMALLKKHGIDYEP